MENQLNNYIKEQFSQGKSPKEIKQDLILQGLSESAIQDELNNFKAGQDTSPGTFSDKNLELNKEKKQESKTWDFWKFKNIGWYEVITGLPAVYLSVDGGLRGALVGILGWGVPLKIVRNKRLTKVTKVLLTIIGTVAYILFYIFMGIISFASIGLI